MKNYYQLLTEPSDASKPLIRPEDTPAEIRKAIKKAMRVWDKRTSASGDARQTAEKNMQLLTEASEVLFDEISKKEYDESLQKERERLAAEAEERRKLEEARQRQLAEEVRRQLEAEAEERRRRREAEEKARREAERRREEEARRKLEELRARQRKRRPSRGGVAALVLNLIILVLIAWPVLSWAHILPKSASVEPLFLYSEYRYLTRTDLIKGKAHSFYTWQGIPGDPEKHSTWSISDVFSYKAANFTADQTLNAVMYDDGALVYDGNYVRFMDYEPRSSSYIALDVEQNGCTVISGRLEESSREAYALTNGPCAVWRTKIGAKKWNDKYHWNTEYNSLSGLDRYAYLFEILTEAEDNHGELGNYDFFTCLYSYGNGELLSYKDGVAWFAENTDTVIRLHKFAKGSGNTMTLYALRSYSGHGLGYFVSGGRFYYVDQQSVMRIRLGDGKAKPELVTAAESRIGSINYLLKSDGLNLVYTLPEEGKWVLEVVDFRHRESHDLKDADPVLFASDDRLFLYQDMEIPKWASSFEETYRKIAVLGDVYGIKGFASKALLKLLRVDFEKTYECDSYTIK